MLISSKVRNVRYKSQQNRTIHVHPISLGAESLHKATVDQKQEDGGAHRKYKVAAHGCRSNVDPLNDRSPSTQIGNERIHVLKGSLADLRQNEADLWVLKLYPDSL